VSIGTWLRHDDQTGISYLPFRFPDEGGDIAQSEHVEVDDGPGLVLDFNGEGQLVGIEFLDAKHTPPLRA
jgi:hypothetical protein